MKTGVAVAGFVVVALTVGTCVACNDDDGDKNGAPVFVLKSKHRDDDGDDRSTGKNSRGKCEDADYCEDNDFSPDLQDSPVILCLPNSTCNFGDGEQASLLIDPRCAPYHCDPQPEGDKHV